MKHLLIIILLYGFSSSIYSQIPNWIGDNWQAERYEQELRFLASDELQGRNTGENGLDVAARYIAELFRENGLLPLPGMNDYFQPVPFKKTTPGQAEIRWLDTVFEQGKNLVVIDGPAIDDQATAVFVGVGDSVTEEEVRGKFVVTLFGTEEIRSPMAAMQKGREKQQRMMRLGAKGILEIYTMQTPWSVISRFFNRERLELSEEEEDPSTAIPYGLVQLDAKRLGDLRRSPIRPFSMRYTGAQQMAVPSYNVLAYKPGSDPKVKDQFIVLSAHYDHIGVRNRAPGEPADQDTIFNGARDNGMGVVALLASAEILSKIPTDRSLIFAAWTAEEKGLLGSSYFISHSPVALNAIRFNLNTDGAGYSDTTLISIMGFDRVGAAQEMEKACKTFGLNVLADPAKEQNLFDRSDNVRFAEKGIPAPTFSPGFRSFDQEIQTYYHREKDNPDSINYRYANAYWKAFTYTAYLIAQKSDNPHWSIGDKYEEAAKLLYGTEY